MFLENISKEYIMRELSPVISVFEEQVIPSRVELLENNNYTLNYAWMYSYEKRLKYRMEGFLGFKLTFDQEKILFGVGGAFAEGLSNAFVHGHRKDNDLPLNVWVAVSEKGLGFIITDQGQGFDFNEIYMKFKKGISFFKIAGNGFPLLCNSSDIIACYRKHGTQLCLLCPIFERKQGK